MNLDHAGSRAALSDPSAFAGGHPLHGSPPALLADADRDALRASSERFALELLAAGVPVEHHVLPGTSHAFLNRPGERAFSAGVRLIADWLARRR
ncbi:alpha/beta hydrolase [Kineococcus auxinigenes]|uniref:alpha/beta hydrolase n=1 Tax=unclassified Kineococcus TaxID=2621656 RepID=UPI003D7CBB3F